MFSRTALIVLLAATAGCGFQMPAEFVPPAAMHSVHIDAVDARSEFYRAIDREMQNAGIQRVAASADAGAVFSITFDQTDQRVLSVSARNVPTEYEVYYTIEYGLVAASGEVLLPSQELTLTRDYTYDSTLVLGKAREEALLREAIVRDLVRIVMRQFATL